MNKRKLVAFVAAGILGIMVVGYNACSRAEYIVLRETETTNPAPVGNQIVLGVCGLINRCHPQVTVESCKTGVMTTSGFSAPLGLPSEFDTFSAIIQAETSGQINGNLASASNCFQNINIQDCQDPNVVGAYDANQSNPFIGSPGVVPVSACSQSYSSGVNLEVPIEMVEHALSSLNTDVAFNRTRSSLNTSDYDGQVTYKFEIVANNTDSANRQVSLVDSNGATVASISVPNAGTNIWDSQRYDTVFTPTSGPNNYRVKLQGTNPSGELNVMTARIRVQQKGATKTKIYIPLMVGLAHSPISADDSSAALDDTTTTAYSQPNKQWYSLWKKKNAVYKDLAAGAPWTFEAVMSNSSGTVFASIFDADTQLQVAESEVSTAAAQPTLVTRSYPDSSPNFRDLDHMQVRIKESTGMGFIYRAGLWIQLTNLSHAEVYFRYVSSFSWGPSAAEDEQTYNRMAIDPLDFTLPSFYNELVSSASVGTTCAEYVSNHGSADSGHSGVSIPASGLNMSSTAPTIQRSPPFSVNSGDRLTVHVGVNAGPGSCYTTSGFVVVGW